MYAHGVQGIRGVREMYAEYNKNVLVHRVQGSTWSTGNVHGVRDCISLYAEYKLSMRYDMESP